MASIVPIVEGDGEIEAVPVLLRRILQERCQRYDMQVAKPPNAGGKGNLVRDLERYLQYAVRTPRCRGVLVLLDGHDDCPKDLALELSKRAEGVRPSVPIVIVCAKREYEAWFLASLETIRGKPVKGRPGLLDSIQFNGSVEDLSDVKGWLTAHMPAGRAYKETSDQAPLTVCLDMGLAYKRSRSFQRLCHAVEELILAMEQGSLIITPKAG